MILSFIVWTVAAAFAVITVLTIVNIFNIRPVVSWFTVSPRFENRLFSALIVEIIVMCLAVAGSVFDDRRDLVSEKQKAETGLELSLEAWESASRSWMNEPSGLSQSGLNDSDSVGPVLVGVDDEESAVFVLHTQPGHFPLVRALLVLVGKDGKAAAEDLEAITYDGSRYYYALASHRQLGDNKKARNSRKLLKFKIPSDSWQDGYEDIVIESSTDLTSLPNDQIGLEQFLSDNGVVVTGWHKKGELPQQYGLEIEGIVYYGGQLYFGLRWPLDSDKALLLSYSIGDQKFNWIRRLDLKAHGISALAVSGEDLIVTSNPPQKVDIEKDPASAQYYGKSRLWRFSIARLAFEGVEGLPALEGERLSLVPKPDAKLEGIAAVGSELFLTFDGEKPYFASIQLSSSSSPAE